MNGWTTSRPSDMEAQDVEADLHLPPLATTPRFLTGPHVVTSQPSRRDTPVNMSVSSVASGRRVLPEIVTTRRSLKQVCRGHRKWTSGLCECRGNSFNCCLSCICPCFTQSNVAEYMGETSLLGCLPCSGVAMRTKVRTVGGIQGSITGDVCVTCWCPCLALSQMAREVDHMVVQPEIYVQPVKY